MKPRRPHPLDELKRRVSATDADVIDELYGLEPVFEPSTPARSGRAGTEFVAVECPYCGERFETEVDLSAGSANYIEDCQVCCRPIDFHCEIDDHGGLVALKPERMD